MGSHKERTIENMKQLMERDRQTDGQADRDRDRALLRIQASFTFGESDVPVSPGSRRMVGRVEEEWGELSLSAQSSFTCPPSGITRNSLCVKSDVLSVIAEVHGILISSKEKQLNFITMEHRQQYKN